ncbi:MAG: hypothetical protein IT459_15380 [Planctomycetes bacterium]|nr:hypothetical protein [Planctomycetota bacterium]
MALALTGCLCAAKLPRRWRLGVAAAWAIAALIAWTTALVIPAGTVRVGVTRALMFHHHVVVDRPIAPAWALPFMVGAVCVGIAAWTANAWSPGRRSSVLVPPFVLGLGVIAGRFALDRAAAPEPVAHAVGLLWWSVAIGPYLRIRDRSVGMSALRLALATRLVVVALNVLATRNEWGTHFSLERVQRVALPFVDAVFVAPPGSLRQFLVLVVLPQLVIWPMLTASIAVVAARAFELVRFRR